MCDKIKYTYGPEENKNTNSNFSNYSFDIVGDYLI